MTVPAPLPEYEEPARTARRSDEPRRRTSATPRRGSAPRDRAPAAAPRRSGDRGGQARSTEVRGRSVAAQRAYARRADRAERLRGAAGKRAAAGRMALPTPASMLSSRATFVVVVMSLLAVGVVATLWLSTQATAGTYRLEKVKQDVAGLSHQVATLRSDVAREQSPASLAAKARQLGMVPAGVPARLKVGNDGKVTVVGTPSKAPPPPAPPAQPPGGQDQNPASGEDAQQAHQQAAPNPGGAG